MLLSKSKHILQRINYSISEINTMLNSLLEDTDTLSYAELTSIHEERTSINEAMELLKKFRYY